MFRRVDLADQEREFIVKYMEPYITKGFVEPTSSRFNSPLFTVPKEPDSPDLLRRYRLVFDERIVNTLFPKMSTRPVPIPDLVHGAAEAAFASTVDLTAGFHQIHLHPLDRVYTAFTLPDGRRFHWTVWPFGFSPSPLAMERAVDHLLRTNPPLPVRFYVDDGVITTG